MIPYLSKRAIKEFEGNFLDWRLGGPKENGWTREGSVIETPSITLGGLYKFCPIKVDEGLAKNKKETDKWHISFLKNKKHLYEKEYLHTRYNTIQAEERVASFIDLFNDIKINGVKKSIWVANVSYLNLGFQYFRFDGCHRLCCCKVLGIKEIPAIVFNIKILN